MYICKSVYIQNIIILSEFVKRFSAFFMYSLFIYKTIGYKRKYNRYRWGSFSVLLLPQPYIIGLEGFAAAGLGFIAFGGFE
jgi:hypothetical protein